MILVGMVICAFHFHLEKKSKSSCDVIFAAICTKQHVLYVWEMWLAGWGVSVAPE